MSGSSLKSILREADRSRLIAAFLLAFLAAVSYTAAAAHAASHVTQQLFGDETGDAHGDAHGRGHGYNHEDGRDGGQDDDAVECGACTIISSQNFGDPPVAAAAPPPPLAFGAVVFPRAPPHDVFDTIGSRSARAPPTLLSYVNRYAPLGGAKDIGERNALSCWKRSAYV